MKTNNEDSTSLASDLIKKLGNSKPSKKQLELADFLLSKIIVTRTIIFHEKLTKRERMCLYWLAMGKDSQEIAELFNVQGSTINYYRKEIKRKLLCKTIAEAVF